MIDEKDILPFDDELIDYLSLNKHLKEDTERKKKQTYLEFDEMGGRYIKEIEKKKIDKELKQVKLITYILKYHADKFDEEELMSYSFEDVNDIYNEIKKQNKSAIVKFFHFLFNVE